MEGGPSRPDCRGRAEAKPAHLMPAGTTYLTVTVGHYTAAHGAR